jgi:integrase
MAWFRRPPGRGHTRDGFTHSGWAVPYGDEAATAAGATELHFHDLRHVSGTLAAATGASLKELMTRLGHSNTRAALIYQHATRDRDQAIAKALGDLVQQVRTTRGDDLNEGRHDA